jgi:hypothetical protein
MVSHGKEEETGSGDFNCFDLARPCDVLVLDSPLRIPDLYATRFRPKCFAPGSQGTIFLVEPSEFEAIVKAILSVSASRWTISGS